MEPLHLLLLADDTNEEELTDAFVQELSKQLPDVDKNIAIDVAHRIAGDLVVGLSKEKMAVVRRLTERAVRDDWSSDVLADRLEKQIGLDRRGSNAVENLRQAMLNKGIPRGVARQQANAYAKRLRTSRAGTIARTELVRLVSIAKREQWAGWKQDGTIDQYAVRVWHTHPDERRCPTCRPMNGQRAAIGKSYSRGHTGPPLHPNCRCWETLNHGQVVLAKRRPRSPFAEDDRKMVTT